MGKRMEELCYELYGSWKQHDSWQRYAMIRELRELMKQPKGGSDHFERFGDDRRIDGDDRRFGVGQFGEGADDDEEQYLVMDEELAETEVATELNGIEDRAVENEANSKVISVIVKEESIPQILMVTEADSTCVQQQVSISPLEHSLNFCKANLDDDACQVFDVIPMRTKVLPKEHKERLKPKTKRKLSLSLKTWMFKFKSTSKRRKSLDVKSFSVEEIAWLMRDSKEIYRSCVDKEFKEVVAGCGKPGELRQVMVIDDVVSLEKHCVQVQENGVQHEKNKAEVVEFFVQGIGVASEMENQTVTAVVVYDKRSDRVWEPGGLPTKLNMWDWTKQHPHQVDVCEFEADLLEVRRLKLSPKPWLFKFKQKLIRLKIKDKEFLIAMHLAPKILKVHHMLNSLVIAEAAAPIYSTIEYLSQFASKVGIDKEHSTSSLKVKKHDNLSWKEDESGSICCILKLGGVAITCKNVLEKIYAENLEIRACRLRPAMMESSVPSKVIGRDGSKRHGRSEIFCEVDAFGKQESSKFQKFAVAFRDISTVAKTQGLGFVHVLHKNAVLDSKLGYLIGNMREEDQKQQGDSELLVIVLECVDAKGGVGMDKKPFHLSLRNHRVWDPGGCISGLSRFC